MKRIGNIYQKLISKENIEAAIKRAAKGKLKRHSVQRVLADVPAHVDKIYNLLKNKVYQPCRVRERTVLEGARQKERKITTINFFPDQIIHWCLILQIQDHIVRPAYALSCGSMPDRGVHYAKKFVERWISKDRKNTKYVAKLDVSKFYPSIPHKYVLNRLYNTFKDKDLLWLTEKIVGHWHCRIESGEKIGLPIGFLTSQWFANHLLQPLDNYIKQQLGIKYYLRYMDDLVLFSRNKKELHKAVRKVSGFLLKIGLQLKSNWQVFRLDSRPIDFMGFRFYREKTTLRRSLMLRICRCARTASKKHAPNPHESGSILSYMGWIKHSDSNGLFNSRIKPFVSIKQAKKAVSVASKKCNQEKNHENCAL
jgi:hypothetical protein